MRQVLDQPQDGAHAELAVGDELVLRIDQQSSGGHLWSLSGVPGFLAEETAESEPEAVPAPGRVQAKVLVFRATGPGSGDLVLTLRRPWEAEPADRRRISVRVR